MNTKGGGVEVFSQSEGKLERSLLWILWKNKTEIVLNMRHSPRADIITYCTAELNLKKKIELLAFNDKNISK